MNRLRPLKHWDRGFESHLRHGCLCTFILFVLSCLQAAAFRRADPPSKESYRLCKRYRSWRPLGLRQVEAPTFSAQVVSPTRRPLLTPRRLLVRISVRGWVDLRAIVRLKWLGKLKKSTSSGTRTGDLSACSIMPQSTTLPGALHYILSCVGLTLYGVLDSTLDLLGTYRS
jgi:hypothetical protein